MNKLVLFIAAVFATFGLIKCAYDSANRHELGKQATGGTGSIHQQTGQAWKPRRYPEMVARLGLETFERATLQIPAVAKWVSRSPACDKVESVGISDSSTPRGVDYFVLCANGFRAEVNNVQV